MIHTHLRYCTVLMSQCQTYMVQHSRGAYLSARHSCTLSTRRRFCSRNQASPRYARQQIRAGRMRHSSPRKAQEFEPSVGLESPSIRCMFRLILPWEGPFSPPYCAVAHIASIYAICIRTNSANAHLPRTAEKCLALEDQQPQTRACAPGREHAKASFSGS